jgi:small ligand-binding sensory domain FIST
VPPEEFALFDGLRDGRSDLDARLTVWARGAEGGLAVVHADPRTPGVPDAIARFGAATGAFLVGGLSSSTVANVQLAGGPTEGGLSGVLLSPELPVLTGLSQGCTPIGPRHRITACHRNLVLTIDGRPALEVLKEEIGELLARDLRRIGGYIHAALPVRGLDRADYLVRNLLAIDPERGVLAVGAALRVGQELLFVKRDGASAQEDLRRMLADLDRRRAGRPVRGALYHACVARGPNMFGPDSAEVGMIREVLGDVPLAGFYANGEIFHDRLYAYTGVLTLFL